MVYDMSDQRVYDRLDLMSEVGRGFRGPLEGFIFLLRPSTSLSGGKGAEGSRLSASGWQE